MIRYEYISRHGDFETTDFLVLLIDKVKKMVQINK